MKNLEMIKELELEVTLAQVSNEEGRQIVAKACDELYGIIEEGLYNKYGSSAINDAFADLCTGDFAEPFMCEQKKDKFQFYKKIYIENITTEESKKGNLNDFIDLTKKEGGCTFNLNTSEINPERGYAVAMANRELVIDNLTPEILKGYIEFNIDKLADVDYFIGSWASDGKVYLDTVNIVNNLEDAIIIGMNNDQLAIFDLSLGKEIKLPGRQTSGTNTQNSTYNKIKVSQLIGSLSK